MVGRVSNQIQKPLFWRKGGLVVRPVLVQGISRLRVNAFSFTLPLKIGHGSPVERADGSCSSSMNPILVADSEAC